MRTQDILIRPLITEKTALQNELGTSVAFQVHPNANKIQIRRAIEAQFKVKVADVRVARVSGKLRRQGRHAGFRSNWKKAYVRLAEGEKPIEFFEGA